MDTDPPTPSAVDPTHAAAESNVNGVGTVTEVILRPDGAMRFAKKQSAYSTPAPRTLRTRPSTSNVAGPPAPASSKPQTTSFRAPTEKEELLISKKTGPEALQRRREELLKEKEEELRVVVDEHDTAVREKFHLERFITMVTGWDPKAAKVETSPVFLDYKRFNHNLFDLAPPQPTNAVAGPSRARSSLPARTTRQQAHEQVEIISAPKHVQSEPVIVLSGKGKGRVSDQGAADPKGKKKAVQVIATEDDVKMEEEKPKGKGKGRIKTERESMPPPMEPVRKKARASIAGESVTSVDLGSTKAKGRASLPNLPGPSLAVKRKPGRPPKIRLIDLEVDTQVEEIPLPPSPAVPVKRGRPAKLRLVEPIASSPVADETTEPEANIVDPLDDLPPPTPTPALPSLAHIPFPPPPLRPRRRRVGPNKIWYTDPVQRPPPAPPHSGNLSSLLTSYIMLEDVGPSPEIPALEARAAREGFILNRVNYLQSQGRLLRLIDEQDADGVLTGHGAGKSSTMKLSAKAPIIARKQDHQDHLMAHMRQVRNAMLEEAKNKPLYCKRIARMISAYWEHIEGREDREKAEVERQMKRRGREVIKALRQKWGLAVKVVKARMVEAQKAEQDRLGKEHLQNMLQRSTGLLEAQQQFEGGLDHEDEGDGEDEDSDGTDDVSAAEDSDGDSDIAEGEVDEDEAAVKGDAEAMEVDEVEGVFDLGEEVEGEAEAAASFQASSPNTALDKVEDERNSADGLGAGDDNSEAEAEAASDSDSDSNTDSAATAPPADIRDLLLNSEGLHSSDAVSPVAISHVPNANGSLQHLTNGDSIGPENHMTKESAVAETAHKGSTAPVPSIADHASHSATTPPLPQSPSGLAPPSSSPPSGTIIASTSPPIIRSRRARKVAAPASLLNEVDPDADDVEFDVNGDLDVERDQELDFEMEDAEQHRKGDGDAVNSEDEGLLADADMPIEEVLRRYGYPATTTAADAVNTEYSRPADGLITRNGDFRPDALANSSMPTTVLDSDIKANGDVKPTTPADQSLLDKNLQAGSSPMAIVDGKRQRRARQVWTPEDNPPPPPKRVRIEEVPEPREATPESSSEEEESEEEEEEEEVSGLEGGDGENDGMEVDVDPNAPKTRPPFLLRGTLRPYQHAGLDWLAGLYANNMNGILADEMGLGKTIQTISLLGHLACDRGVWGQHLVIVPTSVILNWEMEFKKFLPGFKVLTYYGNQKERKEKRVGWLTEHSWQVCITSYQIVLADQHIFRRKSWVYMILDEAHNIKNFRSQRWQTLLGFKAQRRLLLTGTPLQNNLMELWSLLYFLMPHGVAEEATAVVGFANHRDFVEWFSNPMDKAVESGDVLDEQAMATVSKLHTLLRPFILRRLKSEVEKQLPGKFEHVVYCRLSKRQRFLYDEFMSRSSTKDALTNGGYLGVMNTLMQLRKVCNHPDLFEVRPVRTSFAMDRSVAEDFTPLDILVRKRLLAKRDEVDVNSLVLDITAHEGMSGWAGYARRQLDASDRLPHALEVIQKGRPPPSPALDTRTVDGWLKYRAAKEAEEGVQRWRSLRDINRLRCRATPLYGSTFLSMLSDIPRKHLPLGTRRAKRDLVHDLIPPSSGLIMSLDERRLNLQPLVEKFAVIPPIATARNLASLALPSLRPDSHPSLLDPEFDTLHHASTKLQIAFPDSSLLQYDCGKLQKLAEMLRDLKAGGHRVLIFTQMTRVLDILEIFLNYNGHRYLRLDGSTKIEDRQIITERFNSDNKIFCFIASSRSGGVGINLTGADTVFFYDSDWNPSMDRQCMDRAHRIGQTREVHIYRFVSSHTVEENMLKKANQKRLLDKVIIQEGDFTTEFFGKVDWRETLYDGDEPKRVVEAEEKDGVEDIELEEAPEAEDFEEQAPRRGNETEFAKAVAEVEDEEDARAARVALGEGELDMGDFEADGGARKPVRSASEYRQDEVRVGGQEDLAAPEDDEDDEEEGDGGIDSYMLRFAEWDWSSFISYR